MIGRALLVGIFSGLALVAAAQSRAPDVSVFADLRPTLSWREGEGGEAHWYDRAGRPSVVGLRLAFPDGKRIVVSQRLERLPSTADRDSLDEYFIEEPGVWRFGKQVLPIGSRASFRELAPAVRFDTRLAVANLPISIAYADMGAGEARGVVGRIGRDLGVSFAFGEHWGTQSGTLSMIQQPGHALGKGSGFESFWGADATWISGIFRLEAEWMSFRSPEVSTLRELDISDFRTTWLNPTGEERMTFGWARSWRTGDNYFRLEGEFRAAENATWLPYTRLNKGRLDEFGFGVRVRF